jgi:hypothetical protein
MYRAMIVLFLTLAVVPGAEKKPLPGRSGNEKLDVEAVAIVDKEEIKALIGDDLGGNIVVMRVKITPKDGPIKIWLDDFTLLNSHAGIKTTPFQPSQIAGNSKLIVRTTYSDGGTGTVSNGPTWGGLGGRGSQMPGSGSGVGNTAAMESAEAKVEDGSKSKTTPLLEALKQRVLQEKETNDVVTGLLYFPVEGKQKVKDIELYYKNPQQGKFMITFAQK